MEWFVGLPRPVRSGSAGGGAGHVSARGTAAQHPVQPTGEDLGWLTMLAAPAADGWRWATSLREAVSRIGKEFKMKNSSNSNARNGVSTMTFYESIRVCLTKYAEFNGQASRPEFWWFFLFIILVASALAYMSEILPSVFFIAVLLPLLAAGSRRLHDSGKSAWQLLYLLVPVAGIILLGFFWAEPSIDSLSEDNTLPS